MNEGNSPSYSIERVFIEDADRYATTIHFESINMKPIECLINTSFMNPSDLRRIIEVIANPETKGFANEGVVVHIEGRNLKILELDVNDIPISPGVEISMTNLFKIIEDYLARVKSEFTRC